MDTKKNENKFIMRGYRSCVYSAMCEMIHSLRSTNKKNILVYSVMAVLMASLSTWMLFLTPGAMYVGTEFKGGQIVLCSTLIIAFGLIIMSFFYGKINNKGTIWSLIRCLKLIPINIVFVIVYILISIISCYVYLSFVTNAVDVKLITILGIFGVISPLLFAFMLPMVYVNTKSLMNQDCSISRSFRQSYVEGSRNWGFIFATCFLAILCYFIVDFLACIPFYIIQLIYNIAVYGEIAYNDSVGLPTYFGVMTFFMAFFSSFVRLFLFTFIVYVNYNIYQTIECRKR